MVEIEKQRRFTIKMKETL